MAVGLASRREALASWVQVLCTAFPSARAQRSCAGDVHAPGTWRPTLSLVLSF